MLKVDRKKLKSYGDRLNDGAVQISFTFPVEASPESKEAAKRYVESFGLEKVAIASMEPMGKDFTYFVAYGYSRHSIDLTKVKVPKIETPVMKFEELKEYMTANLERPLVVVGAAIGSDAHTVGIDAIMNMKGYDHDYGLERYPLFKAYNLRSQISADELIGKAAELKADAILISQVVTQRDSHIKNLKDFMKMLKDSGKLSKDTIVIIGGPRIEHSLALKLGYDAGFGTGTKPSQVASFIVREYMKRHHLKGKKVEEHSTPASFQDDKPLAPEAAKPESKEEHKQHHSRPFHRGRRRGRRNKFKKFKAQGA